jgi:hypothetical protein
MASRWHCTDTIRGCQKANDGDDEREDLPQPEGRNLRSLNLKLAIDKFLLDGVTVLGFAFELLQDTFGCAWVDFLVALKDIWRGQRTSELCLHGDKLAFFRLLPLLTLSPLLLLPIGKIRLPRVSLALLATFTPT